MSGIEGLHPDLVALADAVMIHDASRYSIRDEPREVEADPQDDGPAGLVAALARDLYERLYIRPTESANPGGLSWIEHRDFLAELSAANGGEGSWEPASVRAPSRNGRLMVRLHGINFRALASQVRATNGAVEAGEPCLVRIPGELRYFSKGFYFAIGNGEQEPINAPEEPVGGDDASLQARYYWHLTREIAPRFIASATSILNAAEIPFRLKVLRDPSAYERADAGVIYLDPRLAGTFSSLIGRIHGDVRHGLRPSVPMLALRLGDGLGLAFDEKQSGSFGLGRCRCIAQSLWDSFLAGMEGRDGRLARLRTDWEAAGFDPERPFAIKRFAVDPTSFTIPEAGAAFPVDQSDENNPRAVVGRGPADTTSPLDAALRIGHHLCKSAHWDRDRLQCNWVGRSHLETLRDGTIEPTASALGADLYGGSAGVAFFLAHLHRLTGDEPCRQTALGAIRRSIRLAIQRPQILGYPVSLYEGRLGIVHVARVIADLLGDPEVWGATVAILSSLEGDSPGPGPVDFLGGIAGAIPALLSLSEHPGLNPGPYALELRSLAQLFGEELCERADRRQGVWTWTPDRDGQAESTSPTLCGVSHGASGIALGLLELHARTGREDFLEAARGAFAYEDSQFHASVGNWPDLRTGGTGPDGSLSRFGRAWCHGAPGIAIARLHASRLDPDSAATHLDVARLALATTSRAIEDLLPQPRQDASLCHGLAGLLDISLIAASHLDDMSLRDASRRIFRALIGRHDSRIDYPSGLPSRATTWGLMLGLAGTGYTFLRLHAPDLIPSILLPVSPLHPRATAGLGLDRCSS